MELLIKWMCNTQIEGMYEVDGNLSVLKLTGKGPLRCTIRKLEVTIHLDKIEKNGKDGAKHWQLKHKDHSYVLKDKSDVVFENLFNGNELIASTAKEVISNTGNEIIYTVGSPVVQDFVLSAVDNANLFFNPVPANELFIE